MVQSIDICENGLYLRIDVCADGDVRLLHLSSRPCAFPASDTRTHRLVQVQVAGENQHDHHGSKYTGTSPARRLKYDQHNDLRNAMGRKLEVIQGCEEMVVTSHIQFIDALPVVRCWTTLVNTATTTQNVEYVSSLALTGLTRDSAGPRDAKMRLCIPHNTWHGEIQWRTYSLPDLGMAQIQNYGGGHSTKRANYFNTGTWSSSGHVPLAAIEDAEANTAYAWQIEHNGSWHWEVSTSWEDLYLQASGPTFNENHWLHRLEPGGRFDSVPVTLTHVSGDHRDAFGVLTQYRRRIRRPNADNVELPVIFNDYMNCLFGDPTEEKLLPLIAAAAEAGCEVFCIDAGWYADDATWWEDVGDWLPSAKRFPHGIQVVLERIRDHRMVPGLWLELESVGISSRLAREAPEDFFFQRNGSRVIDHGRHQLDFRNPAVRAHAHDIMNRLVVEYGVGYLKMDYNINAGPGTDWKSDSLGQGLLDHNRAYMGWLAEVWQRYPNLTIENCASGGMRMDYSMLAMHSIQSTSDQTDYRLTALIAASAFSAVTPEQAAFWSYPLEDADDEAVIYNMVNAMLGRIHQSGHLAKLSPAAKERVRQGIEVYKSFRETIPGSIPFWPLGLPKIEDDWHASGLRGDSREIVAVWRRKGSETSKSIPLSQHRGFDVEASVLFPSDAAIPIRWDAATGMLSLELTNAPSARLLAIRRSVALTRSNLTNVETAT